MIQQVTSEDTNKKILWVPVLYFFVARVVRLRRILQLFLERGKKGTQLIELIAAH